MSSEDKLSNDKNQSHQRPVIKAYQRLSQANQLTTIVEKKETAVTWVDQIVKILFWKLRKIWT